MVTSKHFRTNSETAISWQNVQKAAAEFLRRQKQPTLMGLQVVQAGSRTSPRIQVPEHVAMTDTCRQEVNAWLLEMFGTVTSCLVPRGTCFVFTTNQMVFVHPVDYNVLCQVADGEKATFAATLKFL